MIYTEYLCFGTSAQKLLAGLGCANERLRKVMLRVIQDIELELLALGAPKIPYNILHP